MRNIRPEDYSKYLRNKYPGLAGSSMRSEGLSRSQLLRLIVIFLGVMISFTGVMVWAYLGWNEGRVFVIAGVAILLVWLILFALVIAEEKNKTKQLQTSLEFKGEVSKNDRLHFSDYWMIFSILLMPIGIAVAVGNLIACHLFPLDVPDAFVVPGFIAAGLPFIILFIIIIPFSLREK